MDQYLTNPLFKCRTDYLAVVCDISLEAFERVVDLCSSTTAPVFGKNGTESHRCLENSDILC